MAITDKKTGVWGLDQVYNKVNQGSIWPVPGSVADNHTFWGWGANADGQLGQNQNENNNPGYSSPVQIPGTNWMDIGGIKSDGTLWSMGAKNWGAQGHNPTTSSPVQIGSDTDWKVNYRQEFIGYRPQMAVKTDGTLWAWGANDFGQLGLNARQALPTGGVSSPTQIPGTTWPNVRSEKKFGWANMNPLVIKTDGTLWTWGSAYNGLMAQNSAHTNHKSSPVQIGSGTDWSKVSWNGGWVASAIKTDGTLWVWGNNYNGVLGLNNTTQYSSPTQIPGTTWKDINSNGYQSIATKTDGTAWSWGWGNNAGLGQNDNVSRSSPTQIGSGTDWDVPLSSTSYGGSAIKTDGTYWIWGQNTVGQNGFGDIEWNSSPKQLPGTNWSNTDYLGYGTNRWHFRTI